MRQKTYTYIPVARFDMLDPKYKLLHKMNVFALVSVIVGSLIGIAINFGVRMSEIVAGMYVVYIVCGVVCGVLYPYLHEIAHAAAILFVKGRIAEIKFGKLAASCGAPDITFGKAQYFFVAVFPFIFFCLALTPLCILLPPVYFPLPYIPLMYNIFGSVADFYMIRYAMRTPKRSIVIDCGTEVSIFMPK